MRNNSSGGSGSGTLTTAAVNRKQIPNLNSNKKREEIGTRFQPILSSYTS